MAAEKRVAMIGLGIMGSAMARNLAAGGFAVGGFDIDRGKMAAAAADRIVGCGSVTEAVRGAAVAFTSLPSVDALNATVRTLIEAPQPGLVVAEMSTFPLEAKQAAHDRLAAVGITMLDCPLSGTGAQAVTRDLALYGSGDEAAFADCREAFAAIARVSHYLGAFGNGSRMKFVANLLVAVHNVAAAEAIVLGTKAGLDPLRILDVIGSGAGTSRIFELRGPMMARGVYTPPTATMHVLQKDSGIIAEFARKLGVDTPMLAAAAPLYDEAELLGYGEQDVGAVHAVLARRAALTNEERKGVNDAG
jgi:3-hydroxyisobutyrate dehydrogenase-like beta-hydroxyacid dehydrogenase